MKLRAINRFIFLYLAYLINMSSAKRTFNFNWINITCTGNPDWISINCEILKLKNKNVLNCKATIIADIDEFDVHAVIDIVRAKYDNIKILDMHIDGCNFLKGAEASISKLAFKLYEQFGIPPKKCPIKAGQNYSLTNLYVRPEYLPPYSPNGLYTATIKLSIKDVLVVKTKLYGEISQKRFQRSILQNGQIYFKTHPY